MFEIRKISVSNPFLTDYFEFILLYIDVTFKWQKWEYEFENPIFLYD